MTERDLDEFEQRVREGWAVLASLKLIALARKALAYERALDEISDGDLNYSECVELARETLKKEDAR